MYMRDGFQVKPISTYEIKLEREADCDEVVCCNIGTGNSILTSGLVYRSPNINEDKRLLFKLKSHCIQDCLIDLRGQWLTDRRRRVVLDGDQFWVEYHKYLY